MSTTAIDTNVLLDVLAGDGEEGVTKLQSAHAVGEVVICDIVFAELSGAFENEAALARFLSDLGIVVEDIPKGAMFEGGRRYRRYAREARRTTGVCPRCGAEVATPRVLADFLIAAHALEGGYMLVTRDRGVYRRYFPDLEIAP